MESIHEGVIYSCDLCNYKATQKGYNQQHVRSVHEGVKYNCEQCNYKTTQKCNLLQHVIYL